MLSGGMVGSTWRNYGLGLHQPLTLEPHSSRDTPPIRARGWRRSRTLGSPLRARRRSFPKLTQCAGTSRAPNSWTRLSGSRAHRRRHRDNVSTERWRPTPMGTGAHCNHNCWTQAHEMMARRRPWATGERPKRGTGEPEMAGSV